MKRFTTLLLLVALAGVILFPVCSPVNNSSGNGLIIADGGSAGPMPPWPTGSLLALPGTGLPA